MKTKIYQQKSVFLFALLAAVLALPSSAFADCSQRPNITNQSTLITLATDPAQKAQLELTLKGFLAACDIELQKDQEEVNCARNPSGPNCTAIKQAKQDKIVQDAKDEETARETTRNLRLDADEKRCLKKIVDAQKNNPNVGDVGIEWNGKECVTKYEKDRTPSGDCGNAKMFTGQNKGEACQKAADAVRSSISTAGLGETIATGAAGYAQVQGMKAQNSTSTSVQTDMQTIQSDSMKMAGGAKLATSAISLASAMQLNSAADEAFAAKDKLNGTYSALSNQCDNTRGMSREQCFYAYRGKYGITDTYAKFDNLTNAASEAETQGNRAKNMAQASTISGLADALMGAQAMMMANQATQQAQNMGAPTVAPPQVMLRPFANTGSSTNGAGAAVDKPLEPGDPNAGNNTLGGHPNGSMGGGLVTGGAKYANAGFVGGKSTVGGGGGGGGGARMGQSNASGRSAAKGSGKKASTLGGWELAGGSKGAGTGPGKGADSGTSFTDALSKLFPTQPGEKPNLLLGPNRGLASADDQQGAVDGAQVAAVDLSIFDQITTKYRQLNGAGEI